MAHPAFDLSGKIVVITGGAGLLGEQHARAIIAAGGIPVLIDIAGVRVAELATRLSDELNLNVSGFAADIAKPNEVQRVLAEVLQRHGRVDILINNAAGNTKIEGSEPASFSRFESFSLDQWNADLSLGINGPFICCQVFGTEMARRGSGVILNISSDLGLIAPDQRIYRLPNLPDNLQPVKPVTSSVTKSALIGLTRYLATYWAARGVRVNAICPGGVGDGQPEEFISRLSNLIPMGRMARIDEYQGAILFLCSDASSYMTGAVLAVDGGRTCW
jgi:NAD(P)-dependent dehydrogenase (short-subunit alcohol dehydrogenase family)